MTLKDYLKEAPFDKQAQIKFINSVYKKAYPNPMGRGAIFSFKSGDTQAMIQVEFDTFADGVILKTLHVLEGNMKKGFGSHVLKIITAEADKQDIKLILHPKPFSKEIPQGKLVSFYKKHGFVGNKDRMTREPK